MYNSLHNIIKSLGLQLRRAKTYWSGCCQMAVLSLNLNFSFLSRISLLLISSSYPVVLTSLGGPRSRPYTSRKISRVYHREWTGDLLDGIRRANHYTKQAVKLCTIYNVYLFANTNNNRCRTLRDVNFFIIFRNTSFYLYLGFSYMSNCENP